MITLQFEIQQQSLKRTDHEFLVNKSKNIIRAHFKFSGELWEENSESSVTDLPATGALGTIYLVKGTGTDKNTYDEYFWNTASEVPGYEKFGGIDIDVSSFVTMSQVVEYLGNNGSLTLSDDGELSLNINEPTG